MAASSDAGATAGSEAAAVGAAPAAAAAADSFKEQVRALLSVHRLELHTAE